MATVSASKFFGKNPITVVGSTDQHPGFQSQNDTGFFSDVKDSAMKRGTNILDSFKRAAAGQDPLQTAVQAVGQGAGFVNDVIGSGVKKAVSILPDAIKDPIKKVGVEILQTPAGQAGLNAIKQGVDAYKSWSTKNPAAAADLEGVVNIAALLPIEKIGKVGAEVASDVGSSIVKNATPIAENVGEKVGNNFIKAGERIQNIVLKPSQQDIKNGFKVENLTKYDLNGPLDQVLTKTTTEIKNSTNELNGIIAEMKDKPTLNIVNALNEVAKTTGSKGMKNLGSAKSIEATLNKIRDELSAILPGWENKTIDFADAIEAKRAAGLNAAFLHGQVKQGLTAEERVWNNLYKVLQKETERVAEGTNFKEINRKISDLIPIEQAAIRRIPVAERNNIISLPELISGIATVSDPRALSIGIANRILKSPYAAKYLIKAGKALTK